MLSSSSPAGLALFPLPSRLPSSSPAGRATPPTFERWRLASPTFTLPSPSQLDYGSLGSVWTAGGGWEGSAFEPPPVPPAPTYPSQAFAPQRPVPLPGSGTKGVEPKRIFGAAGKGRQPGQRKKPKMPIQASQLVESLVRRTSSASSSAAASAVAQLDPAFLSNPFFSPFVDSAYATESFLPALDDAGRSLASPQPSPAARVGSSAGGPVGSSSPLQPPTPPYLQPPTPLLKRRISAKLPAVGVVDQTPAPTTSTSATRTILPGDESPTCSIYSLAGVKRRRLLLAEAAAAATSDEEDEAEEESAGESPPAEETSSGDGSGHLLASSLPPPFTSTPPFSPQSEDECKADCSPLPLSLPVPAASLLVRLRIPQARQGPPPTIEGARSVKEDSSDGTNSPSRKRRLSLSSSISSFESARDSTPPTLRRTRRRCPTPTVPLAAATRMQACKTQAPTPAGAVPTAPSLFALISTRSEESSLSPSASSPGPTIFDPGPVVQPSRASSPLSDLSSQPDEIVPLPAEEDEVVPTGGPAEMRSFPAEVDLSLAAEYAAWYRRFNVCRTLWPAFAVALQLPHPTAPTGSRSSGARLSDPRSQGPADLYAPRWIKGIGIDKMAVCPVCFEDGDGYQWHKTKVSQYNFHMLYAHGISPTTGLPFSPPLRFRQSDHVPNRPDEKLSIREGLCHACGRWVAIEGVKAVEVNVKEIFWWRHAQRCHGSSRIVGDVDIWTASPLLACLTNYVDSLPVKEKAGWIVPSEHQSLLADALGRSSRTHRHSG